MLRLVLGSACNSVSDCVSQGCSNNTVDGQKPSPVGMDESHEYYQLVHGFLQYVHSSPRKSGLWECGTVPIL